MAQERKHRFAGIVVLVVACSGGWLLWRQLHPVGLGPGFASANGRIEATEIDVSTKLAGRILDVLADEGDFVTAGQVVAHMDTDTLTAQHREAVARRAMAQSSVETAQSTLAQRQSEKAAADAGVLQREAERDLARGNFTRAEGLVVKGAMSQEEFDTKRAALYGAEAALSRAKADVAAAAAAISTAQAMVITATANVVSAQATVERIEADINDSALKAPRGGRVQYRVSQPGEVLSAGGKVLNMVDLTDVYMTFFLPEAQAGQVKMGAEVRLVLDAAPQLVIPANVTYLSDVAQFTPKTVETAVERQKLTFRLKARVDKELLEKYVHDVKTGLPGMAYVKLDPQAAWPAHLEVRLPPLLEKEMVR
jgi:HlyD family secretion protein